MHGVVSDLAKILVMIGVVLIHGYFVASEYSLVTLRRTRIEQLAASGHAAARLVRATLENVAELVAAVQLGVTMASLAIGALAEPTIASVVQPDLAFIPRAWKPVTANTVAIALAFLLATVVDIVIAELVPKTIALRDPEPVAFFVIRPIRAFIWLFRPVLRLLNAAGEFVVALTGLAQAPAHEAHSTEELKLIVAASARAGLLDADEQEMLVRVLEFSRLTSRQIMVPRTEVVGLEIRATRDQVYETLRTTNHTRYPVYRDSLDNIVGMLYVRDILRRWPAPDSTTFDLTHVMREPAFVPDSVRIDDLLARMRRIQVQIVVVLDEFGGTAGVVTISDVLERIVGEVRDEFEEVGAEVRLLPQGDAVIDGLVLVSDVNERFNLHLDDAEYDTIGGLIWGELGRRPVVGDEILHGGWKLRVEQMDGLRVAQVRLSRVAEAAPSAPQ